MTHINCINSNAINQHSNIAHIVLQSVKQQQNDQYITENKRIYTQQKKNVTFLGNLSFGGR